MNYANIFGVFSKSPTILFVKIPKSPAIYFLKIPKSPTIYFLKIPNFPAILSLDSPPVLSFFEIRNSIEHFRAILLRIFVVIYCVFFAVFSS